MTAAAVRSLFVLAVMMVFLGAPAAAGEDQRRYYIPPVPENMGDVDFYLLTVGVGNQIANRFGHTGIRVVDRTHKTDVVFNWGKFYFDTPLFAWSFFRGSLTYSMGVRTFANDLQQHVESQRPVVQEKFNLTHRQKRLFLEKIAWNAQPQNRDFPYQYWYRNCATVPRDYIDGVLDGLVRDRFFRHPANIRFRDYVIRHLSFIPFVAPTLDILMNGNIDRPITAWEEMFLPEKLRSHLLTLPATDDEGRSLEGSRLLSDTTWLLEYPEDFAPVFHDWLALALPMAAPVFVAVLLLTLGFYRRMRGLPARLDLDRLGFRALGIAQIFYGVFGGVFGSTLLLNWLFSGHPDGWSNVNLLLFMPVDFLLVGTGIAIFRCQGPVRDRFGIANATTLLTAVHIAAFAVLVVLKTTGLVQHDFSRIGVWFMPPMLVVMVTTLAAGLLRSPAGQTTGQTDRAGSATGKPAGPGARQRGAVR